MAIQFATEDEGKPIVDINNERVGTVVKVERGTAYADLQSGFVSTLKSTLGLESSESGLYRLQDEMVDTVKDDKVRLSGDHLAQ